MYIDAQSALSNKLDPNDLQLCERSRVEETELTEFWVGKYRGTRVNVEMMTEENLETYSTKIENEDAMMQMIR